MYDTDQIPLPIIVRVIQFKWSTEWLYQISFGTNFGYLLLKPVHLQQIGNSCNLRNKCTISLYCILLSPHPEHC